MATENPRIVYELSVLYNWSTTEENKIQLSKAFFYP